MANVEGTFYTATTQRRGVTPVSPPNAVDDPVEPVQPVNTTTYKALGDVTDKSFVGKNGYSPIVVNENELQLVPNPAIQKDGLIPEWLVQWTGTDYDFNVFGEFFVKNGIVYPFTPQIASLNPADPTNDRIDVLAVDIDSNLVIIEGTPSPSPVKPQIDPETQIEITFILVTAASTTPVLTEEVVYDENIEWTGSSSGTGTANFASTTDPFQGTVSIETTNIQNGFTIILDNGVDFDLGTVQTLGFQIRLKSALPSGQNILLSLLDASNNTIAKPITIVIDKGITTYQFSGVILSSLGLLSNLVRKVRFAFTRTSGSNTFSGYFLDIIKFEGGINPPTNISSFLNLSDTPASYSGQALKVVRVNAGETALEFNTFAGLTGSGTANEIAYFTGATALASLPVATYPSLTELSYVKGVTSDIQTQINGKQATIAGTLTNGYVATVVAGVPTWEAPAGGSSNWTVTGSAIYRNSRVLIGSTAFTAADTGSNLEVNGRVSQSGLGNSTFFGLEAGEADDLTNNNNAAFGVSALKANTTGTGNCAFGYNTLLINVSGAGNSAFGNVALQNNTGSNNAAFGSTASQNNTSGVSNCAFGAAALFGNLTGNQNNAFGVRALFNNTSSFNCAFGFDSMFTNGSGNNNSAYGYLSLRANSTGSLNSAYGSQALTSSTGSNNTGIGAYAMILTSSGSDNVALGYNSGRYFGAGTSSNATSNNSVFLGSTARANNTGETNQIVIGHNALGAGSNSATIGNTSIVLTILRGTVNMAGLPTAAAGLNTGDVWNNGGVLNIV